MRKRVSRFKKQPRVGYCFFCKENKVPDYKDFDLLNKFLTPRRKMLSRRVSGFCAKHQRQFARAVKRARNLGLI
ncbi:30S ribosomal protein S18 [candidate division CPR3 bacterium 4484_211]|uniref:30S ribosomal protein S18 n=1 Tax=candidate division CPR3 bacterium 4484_211 TaxID=1968527 RepID=A0A1W9NZU4_UNCC3|nr:MAG: 30S ribosomal protein S18 [candidate division CPR3 bacterium 4484_211]